MKQKIFRLLAVCATIPSLGHAHELSQHMDGTCEFHQKTVDYETILAALDAGEAPCMEVEMTKAAAKARIFLLPLGARLECEFEYDEPARRYFFGESARHLHFSHLNNDSDITKGEIVVQSCVLTDLP